MINRDKKCRLIKRMGFTFAILSLLGSISMAQGMTMQNNGNRKTHFVPLRWYTARLTRKSVYNKKIDVSLNQVTLEQAIKTISLMVPVRISYNKQSLPHRKVTVNLKNISVMDAIDRILKGTDIKALGSPNDQIVLVKRVNMIKPLSAMLIQQDSVSGRVTDADTHEPLPGVNILVKGTTTGTATDKNGNYTLGVPSLQDTLVVSYIGYETKTIPINGRPKINVALKIQSVSGGQLVVVGYRTQRKATLTGAVGQVEGKALAQAPVANISHSIVGNVAGVSISSHMGQPGQNNPDIHIRGVSTTGNSQPLIVVDGIERDNLSAIDPSTIKSVSVLKDAAAVAPYGMGGANGVILITTKEGQPGKPVFSLHTEYGYSNPTYYPSMLDARDFMKLTNEAYLNENPGSKTLPYSKDLIANYLQLNAKNPDKYPISNNAGKQFENLSPPRMKTSLQVSGGTSGINYYASLGFTNQDGMFYNVNYRRYDYTVNLDAQATPTTKINLSVIGAIEHTGDIDAGLTTYQLFRSGNKFRPIANLYYSNGLWGQDAGNSPIGIINSGGYQHKNNNQLLTKIMINQQLPFIKGLSAKLAFSYDPDHIFSKNYHRPYYFYTQDLSTDPPTYTKSISTSEGNVPAYTYLDESFYKAQHFTYQAYLNYQGDFGKNHVTGLLVAEARNSKYNAFSAHRDHFAVNVDELSLGPSNKQYFNNAGVDSTESQVGFVYELGYNYAGKYLFQVTGRYDGNFYFAPGHRWGYFPAFSAGWVLSEEKFIKLPSFINFLKIRGSWGKAGNLAGTSFQYLNGYNLVGADYAFGSGSLVQGSYIPHESNPEITWEISTKTDVGLDMHLWNDLLTVDLDYFHGKRTGMLLPPAVTVPVEYGLALSEENAGIMENHGFEATISANTTQLGNGLQLGFTGTFSYAKNKMDQIFETSATFNDPSRRRTGRSYNTPFGLHALGLFTTADDKNGDGIIDAADGYKVKQFGDVHPGDIKYADMNGDGVINNKDYVPIGYPSVPEITFGFNPTASWKGFDLSLSFQGSALSSTDVRGFHTMPFYNNDSNTAYEYYNHRWTPNHQDALYPRATSAPTANNNQASDFWEVSTSYVRLKTAVLGYTIPHNITNKLDLRSLRVYFSGQNLFTISKLSFIDPQSTTTGGTINYPLQKIYTAGVNIDF